MKGEISPPFYIYLFIFYIYLIKVCKAGRQTDALMELAPERKEILWTQPRVSHCLTESVSGHITVLSCKVLFLLLFTVAFV